MPEDETHQDPPEPAPQAPQKAAPPPQAPGFGETFESSLLALFTGPGAFRRLAARPAPSVGASAAFALLCGAAALVAQLLRVALERPGMVQSVPPAWVAAVGVAGFGLVASLFLLAAVFLYGLGNALGGKGEFDRAWQAAAALSVLAPLQALCGGMAVAWAAPAVLAAWLGAGALEGLLAASPWPSRAVCAVIAAAGIGVQFAVRSVAEKAIEGYETARAMTQSSDSAAELARQMAALQAAMPGPASPAPLIGAPDGSATPPPAPGGGGSSLDLLRPMDGGPAGGPDGGQGAPTPQASLEQNAASMNASAVAMLDSVSAMLNNPLLTANLTAEGKKNMAEIQSLMKDLRAQGVTGKRLSNEEFSARMQRVQQLSVKIMMDSASHPPAATPAPADGAPHLKLSGGKK